MLAAVRARRVSFHTCTDDIMRCGCCVMPFSLKTEHDSVCPMFSKSKPGVILGENCLDPDGSTASVRGACHRSFQWFMSASMWCAVGFGIRPFRNQPGEHHNRGGRVTLCRCRFQLAVCNVGGVSYAHSWIIAVVMCCAPSGGWQAAPSLAVTRQQSSSCSCSIRCSASWLTAVSSWLPQSGRVFYPLVASDQRVLHG